MKHLLASLLSIVLIALYVPALADSNFAEYKGTQVHYTDQGEGLATLVLVHGWSCDLTFWDAQLSELSKDMRVIAVDLPGHGLSTRAGDDFSQQYYAGAVEAVMEQAEVDWAVLCGHSMGASVIRWTAELYPDRVAGLVIIDGVVMPPLTDPLDAQEWHDAMSSFADQLEQPDAEDFMTEFINGMQAASTPDELKKDILQRMKACDPVVRSETFRAMADPSIFDLPVQHLSCLAIFAFSPDLPPEFATIIAEPLPNVEYLLWEGPGHFIMMEMPEQVNEMILDFVSRMFAG